MEALPFHLPIIRKDGEGILFAKLDIEEVRRGKLDFDVTGHYARPDVFKLVVNEERQRSVVWDGK